MSVSFKIAHSLRILGLPPGATASEVRSAFRRLARTCHPDIAGRQGARKFEQITGAYTFLKGLTQDELRSQAMASTERESPAPEKKIFRSGWIWESPWAWHRKRRERFLKEEERREREAHEEEEKIKELRERRVDLLLDRGEQTVESLLERMEQEARSCETQGLRLRLASAVPEVRRLALSRLGGLANRGELFEAVVDSLLKWDIDDKTARLVAHLPLDPKNRRKLAEALFVKAETLNDGLLAHLLDLRGACASDRELRERYLQNVGASGAALILRYWPKETFVSASALRVLLSRDAAAVLVPLLSMMKQRGVPCPFWGYERLRALLSHSDTAVRVWAKALLPQNENSR